VCLFCGETHCSRYAKGHALSHHQETKAKEEAHTHVSSVMFGATLPLGHFLAVSLMDLSVWCYECQGGTIILCEGSPLTFDFFF
jgi:hypothetical protein